MHIRRQQGIRETGSREVGTLCAKRFVQDAVFIVKPLPTFARAGLPVYRAGQDQDERAATVALGFAAHYEPRAVLTGAV